MKSVKICVGSVIAAAGVALVTACSSAPTEDASSTADPLVGSCVYTSTTTVPWMLDASCGCSQYAGNQIGMDQCSYERTIVQCLNNIGYPHADCSSSSLPPLLHVTDTHGGQWVDFSLDSLAGKYDCTTLYNLRTCIDKYNVDGIGPAPWYNPYNSYPVSASFTGWCNSRMACGFTMEDVFDPCGSRSCFQ